MHYASKVKLHPRIGGSVNGGAVIGSRACRTSSAVVLVVVKGQDFGRSIVVNLGHCVMIGRSEQLVGATGMITQHSAGKLGDEDGKQVSRHLKIRATPKNQGARSLLTSFERDMDVGLRDDSVSQRHAMVSCDEAGAALLDMASTNGTFLNGKRTASAELRGEGLHDGLHHLRESLVRSLQQPADSRLGLALQDPVEGAGQRSAVRVLPPSA
jgi:hypothetical protein